MTLEQHIKDNLDAICAEALVYAKTYGVDLNTALRDVREEYVAGWHEAGDQLRNGDYQQDAC